MGKPKALRDHVPKSATKIGDSGQKKKHVVFDDNEDGGAGDQLSEEEQEVETSIARRTRSHSDMEGDHDDDAPEEVSKEKAMTLYNLKELYDQELSNKKADKMKRKREGKVTATASTNSDSDGLLDDGVLAELSKIKEGAVTVAPSEESSSSKKSKKSNAVAWAEEEEATPNYYGNTRRKIGKISVEVLGSTTIPSAGYDDDEDPEASSSLSSSSAAAVAVIPTAQAYNIFDHFKLSEDAHEFSAGLMRNHDRVKYSTMRSQRAANRGAAGRRMRK